MNRIGRKLLRRNTKIPKYTGLGYRVATKVLTVEKQSTAAYSAHFAGQVKLPKIDNEPVKTYASGSEERKALLAEYEKIANQEEPVDIPIVINGKRIYTDKKVTREFPSDRSKTLYRASVATPELMKEAIDGALAAKKEWESMPVDQRLAIFLKAADLLAGEYRNTVLAATMAGQGKTMHQAEIDAACEAIDFFRFNAKYAEELYASQPEHHAPGVWNKIDYRPLEGFVAAISPFNFTAIGSNLVSTPLQLGNVCLWKPAQTALLSNFRMFELLEAAGLPAGVLQFVPCSGKDYSENVLVHEDLAGVHFTGSTAVFNEINKTVYGDIERYNSYPRVVGETGGKNFHVIHPSADVDNAIYNTVRGAFEFSGQKCSATSRVYVPASLADTFKERLSTLISDLKVDQPNNPESFTSCVIDQKSFDKITGFLDRAKQDDDVTILAGGNTSDEKGFFVEPSLLLSTNPHSETMREEIFGPVLTMYIYEDDQFSETLDVVSSTTKYGLTGSIFAKDRQAVIQTMSHLRHAAGNFYINDKCTGAVVGQQPFGGSRASGTNDKAGAIFNLQRWLSLRSVKENFVNLRDHQYPSTQL